MARLPDLLEFAAQHGLKIGAISDLIHYRAASEKLVSRVAEKEIVCAHGDFRVFAYADQTSGEVHLALVKGDIRPDVETLVRVHEPTTVLDFLDCRSQRHSFTVDHAMRVIKERGAGVIVLLRRAESNEDLVSTLTNDTAASRPATKWDPQLHGIGAQILRDLNVGKMRVLANPRKMPSMAGFGLEICGYLTPEGVLLPM